jgi:hypothetical protein
MIPRTLSEMMHARLEYLRLGLGSSLLGVVATTAGSFHRYVVYLIFFRGWRIGCRP